MIYNIDAMLSKIINEKDNGDEIPEDLNRSIYSAVREIRCNLNTDLIGQSE